MHGLISSEQQMFGDAVKRFAERAYGFGPAPHGLSFERGRLAQLAELGCLSLAIPEELGGFGGTAALMVAMAALGPALAPEPVVASGIHAAALIATAAPEPVREEYLAAISEGRSVVVVADLECDARYDRSHVETSAQRSSEGYLLSGFKPMVPFATEADVMIVSAECEGELALFAVEPGEGVICSAQSRIDGLPAGDVGFSGCFVPETAKLDAAPALKALEQAADIATAAQIGEMVGLMDALIGATIEYARTRKQFGVAIGSFQALQHRIADMWIATEEARSLAVAAALSCGQPADVLTRTVSTAMIMACDAAERVGNEAIQIHGGIGMTDELIVSHWYRRLWALRQELGDSQSRLARLAA